MNFRLLTAIILLILSISIDIFSFEKTEFEKAMEFIEFKEYEKAIPILMELAGVGNPGAQYQLGVMFHNGYGVHENYEDAFKWYKLSAEQGQLQAKYALWYMYYHGEGVVKDNGEAFKWLILSAEGGMVEAQEILDYFLSSAIGGDPNFQFMIGGIYLHVLNDNEKALTWIQKAADQGLPVAQCDLGGIYFEGNGVKKDYNKAFKLFKTSAEQNIAEAQLNLGIMYIHGDGTTRDMGKARYWIEKAINGDNTEISQFASMIYKEESLWQYSDSTYSCSQPDSLQYYSYDLKEGIDFFESGEHEKALNIFRRLAEKGDPEAQFNLGLMYDNGMGLMQNSEKALKWYKASAKQDFPKAQNNLGMMYDYGRGVVQDKTEAVKWYKLAAAQGDLNAQCTLGVMYTNGEGVRKDINQAINWWKLAAKSGYPLAQYNLGYIYAYGENVSTDMKKAKHWIYKAWKQNDYDGYDPEISSYASDMWQELKLWEYEEIGDSLNFDNQKD